MNLKLRREACNTTEDYSDRIPCNAVMASCTFLQGCEDNLGILLQSGNCIDDSNLVFHIAGPLPVVVACRVIRIKEDRGRPQSQHLSKGQIQVPMNMPSRCCLYVGTEALRGQYAVRDLLQD